MGVNSLPKTVTASRLRFFNPGPSANESSMQIRTFVFRTCVFSRPFTTTFKSAGNCHHHFLYFGQENRIFLPTRSVLWSKICRNCDSGRGSAPDPAGGAHDAPPNSVVGWGADTLLIPTPLGAFGSSMLAPSAPQSSCPLTPNPGDATGHHHFLR